MLEIAAAEVACKHAGCRNETGSVGRIGPGFGSLIAREEERLVLDDRSTQSPAVLVTLQSVAPGSEKVSRIHLAVTKELERVAVERICARLHNRVHCSGRVHAVLRGECARLHLELLQGVGERKRKIHSVKRVVVERSIQIVSNSIELPTGDGDVQTARHASSAGPSCGNRAARQLNQFHWIASIEGQFQNALVLDDGSDAGCLGFDKCGIRLHLNLLGHRTYLERNINGWIRGNLQHDPRLYICSESGPADLQPIRSKRQVGQYVSSVFAAGDRADDPGIGLRGLHFGTTDSGAARVVHNSLDLGCGLSPKGYVVESEKNSEASDYGEFQAFHKSPFRVKSKQIVAFSVRKAFLKGL